MALNDKYMKLLRSNNKVDYLEGTTYAGKTTVGVGVKFLIEVAKSNKKDHIIAGNSVGEVESKIINQTNGIIDLYGKDIQYFANGNGSIRFPHLRYKNKIIYIVGFDNKSRFKKILGGQFGCVAVDEFQIADMDFIREIFLPRFEYLIATMNPDNPDLEQFTDFVNNSTTDISCINDVPVEIKSDMDDGKNIDGWVHWFFTYNDNAIVTPEKVDQLLEYNPVGTKQYETKIRGLRSKATGLCVNLDKSNVINRKQLDELKLNFTTYISSLDTSYSKNTKDVFSFGFGGITTTGEFVQLEQYAFNNTEGNKVVMMFGKPVEFMGIKFKTPLAPSEVCYLITYFLNECQRRYGFSKEIIIDSPATIIEYEKLAHKHNWNYQPANANIIKNDVLIVDRILFMNSWLSQKKMYILDNCITLIKELNVWSFTNEGIAEDRNNHCIDALCYEFIPFVDKIGVERNWY